jgi:hypothetical protein
MGSNPHDIITERNAEIRELESECDLLRGETGSLSLYIEQLLAQATEKDARIASLAAEVERRQLEAENWRRLYRELYCEIWCATEEEFDEVSFGEGLAHTDTLKELVKMIRCQMSQKEDQPDAN